MAASSWRRLLASRLVVLFTGFRPLSYTVNLVPIRLDLQWKHNRKHSLDPLCSLLMMKQQAKSFVRSLSHKCVFRSCNTLVNQLNQHSSFPLPVASPGKMAPLWNQDKINKSILETPSPSPLIDCLTVVWLLCSDRASCVGLWLSRDLMVWLPRRRMIRSWRLDIASQREGRGPVASAMPFRRSLKQLVEAQLLCQQKAFVYSVYTVFNLKSLTQDF